MTCARSCSCTLIRTQNLLQARPTPAPMPPIGRSALSPADPLPFTEPPPAIERGVPSVEAPAIPSANASVSDIADRAHYLKLRSSTQQQGWRASTDRSKARYGKMQKPGFVVQQAHKTESVRTGLGFTHAGPSPLVMPPYVQQQVKQAPEIAFGLCILVGC